MTIILKFGIADLTTSRRTKLNQILGSLSAWSARGSNFVFCVIGSQQGE